MRNIFLLIIASMIAACATPSLQIAKNIQAEKAQWQVDHKGISTLVIAVPEEENWRWLWIDALGLPIARQTLHNGQWQADGLLPPNDEAISLFAALMWLGSNTEQRQIRFPAASIVANSPVTVQQNGKTLFTYDCKINELSYCLTMPHTLSLPNNVHYNILSLTKKP